MFFRGSFSTDPVRLPWFAEFLFFSQNFYRFDLEYVMTAESALHIMVRLLDSDPPVREYDGK
jgi:hypothetical protein